MSATQYAGPKGNNKSTGTVTATLPDGTFFPVPSVITSTLIPTNWGSSTRNLPIAKS